LETANATANARSALRYCPLVIGMTKETSIIPMSKPAIMPLISAMAKPVMPAKMTRYASLFLKTSMVTIREKIRLG